MATKRPETAMDPNARSSAYTGSQKVVGSPVQSGRYDDPITKKDIYTPFWLMSEVVIFMQ